MGKKVPGMSLDKGLPVVEFMRIFPDNASAELRLAENRWPHGIFGLTSIRIGTVVQGLNLDHRTWTVAIYPAPMSFKSISGMKLRRSLNIARKLVRHMAHPLREALGYWVGVFGGSAETDETYFGDGRKNSPEAKREPSNGRETACKSLVISVKDRKTNEVQAKAITSTDVPSPQCFVCASTEPGATAGDTDEASAYVGLASAYWYEAGIDGAESFWSTLQGTRKGALLKISLKHLDRHVVKFAERLAACEAGAVKQVAGINAGIAGEWFRYNHPIADNNLNSKVWS